MGPSVLQLISSSGFYGAERVLLELALHLAEEGCASHVGIFHNQGTTGGATLYEEARRHGLQVFRLPCAGSLDAGVTLELRRYVASHGVEIVHSHGYKADIYTFLSRLPRQRVRLVATCHNWLTDSPRLMVYELLDKLVLHQFDRVVGVSPALDHELAEAGIARRALIENGLSPEPPDQPVGRAELRRRLGLGHDDPVLIAVGRMDPFKDHALLLEALARPEVPPQAKLLLVGDGELRGALEAQAASSGLAGRVVFAGYRRDIEDLLRASDLFVISSNKEGLPMVLLEAMAAGVPVVSTAVGAIGDAVRDGEEALLVPPRDAGALAAAVARLLEDAAGARRLAEGARRRYDERYSRRAMGARYMRLYRDLLADGPGEDHHR